MKNKLLPLFVVLGLGSFSAYSQVGIGTNNPDPSAQLHVQAANRGVLIPNVKLTSTIVASPVINPANSLLVFNTETASDVTPGYYYWYDNKWNRIGLASEISGGGSTTALPGVPGKAGEAGYPGRNISIYTDTLTNIVYVQNTNGTWSPINGKDGKDGISGAPGLAGGIGVPGVVIIRVHF